MPTAPTSKTFPGAAHAKLQNKPTNLQTTHMKFQNEPNDLQIQQANADGSSKILRPPSRSSPPTDFTRATYKTPACVHESGRIRRESLPTDYGTSRIGTPIVLPASYRSRSSVAKCIPSRLASSK